MGTIEGCPHLRIEIRYYRDIESPVVEMELHNCLDCERVVRIIASCLPAETVPES